MVAGRPVVCTRAGGLPEIVADGETGILSDPGDVGGLVASIRGLFSAPDTCRRMGLAGHERARDLFSRERFVARIMAIYGQLIGSEQTGLLARGVRA